MSNAPLSEQIHIAWDDWSDKKAAADFRTEMKTAFLAQKIKERGDLAYNRAERDVKASPEWRNYIQEMVDTTAAANRARGRLEYLKAKQMEWQNAEANHRAAART